MALTVRELNSAPVLELHSQNVKSALALVLEDLVQVEGLLARFETELLTSAGSAWEERGLDAILAAREPLLPESARYWRRRYRVVRNWMESNLPGRFEHQQQERAKKQVR